MFLPPWPKDARTDLPMEESLPRMAALLEKLSNPQHSLPPAILVSGTNGKGSTIAFLKALLEGMGKTVHVYTSPHIHHFNERIVTAGREISDAALTTLAQECEATLIGQSYTFFEATTAAAFLAFSRTKADYMLVECGCGGRFDATNILPNILCTIITSLSMDHPRVLANGPYDTALANIAWHKAGIMRADTPCIVTNLSPETMPAIAQEASRKGANVYLYGWHWGVEDVSSETTAFRYVSTQREVDIPPLPLPGEHQWLNAANAIAALEVIPGLTLDDESIRAGLTNVRWPGRGQRITTHKLKALLPHAELWMDAAHNPDGATALARILAEQTDKPNHLIVGLTRGRNAADFLHPLAPRCASITAIPVAGEPDSQSPQDIQTAATGITPSITCQPSLAEALKTLATQHTKPHRIWITGSIYLLRDIEAL